MAAMLQGPGGAILYTPLKSTAILFAVSQLPSRDETDPML